MGYLKRVIEKLCSKILSEIFLFFRWNIEDLAGYLVEGSNGEYCYLSKVIAKETR